MTGLEGAGDGDGSGGRVGGRWVWCLDTGDVTFVGRESDDGGSDGGGAGGGGIDAVI